MNEGALKGPVERLFAGRRWQWLAAIASGGLVAVGFLTDRGGWTAWFGLVPLIWAVRGLPPGKAWRRGLAAGLVFHGLVLYWMTTLVYWAGAVALLGQVLLVTYLALYWALFAAGHSWLEHRIPRISAVVAPFLWCALEFLQGKLFTGFGWGLLGYTQWRSAYVVQWAALGGVYVVSMILVGCNVFLSHLLSALLGRRWMSALKWAGPIVIAGIVVVLEGRSLFNYAVGMPTMNTVRIGVVQGSFSMEEKWNPDYYDYMLAVQRELTRYCMDEEATVIIWPETAYPGVLRGEAKIDESLSFVLWPRMAFLVTGAVYQDDKGNTFNSALVFRSYGSEAELLARYDKIHLVPFGEYVPLGHIFPWLAHLMPIASDFVAGEKPIAIGVEKGAVGPLICFEISFPSTARELCRRGATYLVSMSNLAWFGASRVAKQVLAHAVLRAIENRVPVICASNTGISCFIDPTGLITKWVGRKGGELFVRGYAVQTVPYIVARSDYTRWGDVLCYFSFFVVVFAWFARRYAERQYRMLIQEG